MGLILRRLTLGMTLIVGMAGILLVSDLGQRRNRTGNLPRVAFMPFSTTELFDEGSRGVLEALSRNGYVDGKNLVLTQFNPQGDVPTATTLAKELTDGRFDMVITLGTGALQAVANANTQGKAIHVFGAVTDPFAAGVGISPANPLDHPRYMAGIGTFQPVENSIDIAREMYPALKKLGVVWNASEACSQACTLKARRHCTARGIELVETNVDNSSMVQEATRATIAKGAQAIWVGGDITVSTSIDAMILAARNAGIPVFTNTPGDVRSGALFSLGANYVEVGRIVGDMAADILKGRLPSTVRIENVVPERLGMNLKALKSLRDPWHVSPALMARAETVVTPDGVVQNTTQRQPTSPPLPTSRIAAAVVHRPNPSRFRAAMVWFSDTIFAEQTVAGMKDGLRQAGFTTDTNLDLKLANAQGDVCTLNNIMTGLRSERRDAVLTVSTPTLQAAIKHLDNTPIVFTTVANAALIGAGKSDDDHLPNVTGVNTEAAYEQMIGMLQACLPRVKRIGTLFTPSETNSTYYVAKLKTILSAQGIELVTVPASTPTEVAEGALSLCQRRLDAICQIPDNLTVSAFSSIAVQAERSRLPLFSFMSRDPHDGALLAVARDYHDAGYQTGQMAARILRGERPADIPFGRVQKTRVIINLKRAQALGMTIPERLIAGADEVIR